MSALTDEEFDQALRDALTKAAADDEANRQARLRMVAARHNRRILQRLNRRPMPVKWQLTVFAVLSAAALLVGALGWMCRH